MDESLPLPPLPGAGPVSEILADLSDVNISQSKPGSKPVKYRPFFSSVMVKRDVSDDLDVANGGIVKRKYGDVSVNARVEARMGSYTRGCGMGSDKSVFPLDSDDAAMSILRELSDEAIWGCIDDFEDRYNQSIGMNYNRDIYRYFSKEAPVKYRQPTRNRQKVDLKEIEDMLTEVTAKMKEKNVNGSRVFNSIATFGLSDQDRYLKNSEGTDIYTNYRRFNLFLSSSMRDESALKKNNSLVWNQYTIAGIDMSNIPKTDDLLEIGERLVGELYDIARAPQITTNIYPAIMCPKNHGVLWHEMAGHSMEGHRIQEKEDGENNANLFKGRIGEKITPEFLSLCDDPTREDLDGFYRFDDEGVPAQRVNLVENGKLKDFLHCRESAGYFRRRSNGHARAEDANDPVARMSNLIVKSDNEVSYGELKENLVREIVNQKKRYGIILEGTMGGQVDTEEAVFNTFPVNLYKVDKKGREKRVKGIYIVGTPNQILESIIQTSDYYDCFNGSCGAESGRVPSTETAPHALLRSLEVNMIPSDCYIKVPIPIINGYR